MIIFPCDIKTIPVEEISFTTLKNGLMIPVLQARLPVFKWIGTKKRTAQVLYGSFYFNTNSEIHSSTPPDSSLDYTRDDIGTGRWKLPKRVRHDEHFI